MCYKSKMYWARKKVKMPTKFSIDSENLRNNCVTNDEWQIC